MVLETQPTGSPRRQFAIAKEVFTTLLADQVAQSESLNSVAGALAGLAGVTTTLAGLLPSLTRHDLGRAGMAAAGLTVGLAVVGLLWRRPGREPVDGDLLLYRILHTSDLTTIEDGLLYSDVAAAKRNDRYLKGKGRWVFSAALSLAGAVALIVASSILFGSD